ncbi:hypothetical protein, partial [Geobacillus thermocatenulatus]|uniref:hypothetical protein n=1 Tax=Geobacillus thermocatenulatus TaxID=33938 RepID=UPI001C10EE11
FVDVKEQSSSRPQPPLKVPLVGLIAYWIEFCFANENKLKRSFRRKFVKMYRIEIKFENVPYNEHAWQIYESGDRHGV